MTHIKKPASASIPPGIVSISDYEKSARDYMRHDIAEYVYSGSGDEQTLYRNRYGFQNYQIYNRVLADFSESNTSVQLFGKTLAHPFILAPVAHQGLVHPDGERATAMAANAMQTPMIISSLSNIPVEEITAQKGNYWFQLYWQGNRVATLSLLKRALEAGVEVIVITLDAAVSGVRNRPQRAGFFLPEALCEANLSDLPPPAPRTLEPDQSPALHGFMQDTPGVEDLLWLREQTNLPLLAKGVTHPADAVRLMNIGFDGIIVSNHGGRTLDGMPAAIDCIAPIRKAVGAEYPILFDSGIRRGTDALTALALGANAVCIGRPQMWGLAVAGAAGVAHCIRIFQEELEIAMALSGCPSITDITSEIFWASN